MNSLKHLGLPIMAVGAMEGPDELRWRDGDDLRKVFLDDGRIVGFRFAGDISGGGLLRSFLLRGEDVRRFGRDLVRAGVRDEPRWCCRRCRSEANRRPSALARGAGRQGRAAPRRTLRCMTKETLRHDINLACR